MNGNDELRNEQAENASFGKFKSADELLTAYRNLESEFTKKCQLLKRLSSDNAIAPDARREKISDKLKEKFEQAFEGAAAFAGNIEKEWENNAQFEDEDLLLQAVLGRSLHSVLKDPSFLIEDEAFLSKYVYGNATIKDKIIDEYLENLPQKFVPDVVKGEGAFTLAPPRKPSTLSEAGELTKKLLNDRRM